MVVAFLPRGPLAQHNMQRVPQVPQLGQIVRLRCKRVKAAVDHALWPSHWDEAMNTKAWKGPLKVDSVDINSIGQIPCKSVATEIVY